MVLISRAVYVARRYHSPVVAVLGLVAGIVTGYGFGLAAASRLIFLITLIVVGLPVVTGTVAGMLRGNFSSDVVATLAIVGAAITGEYLAGCVIALMQTGGEALEDFAVRRASASLEVLLERAPRIAHRHVDHEIEDVPVEMVAVGDHLLVRPGEIIPTDGIVLGGVAAVDESALTGEPVPVTVQTGSEVMSGSICMDGALDVRALRPSSESQYEQIVALVRSAQQDKAPIGRLADRYAIYFTPLTLLMCALAWLLTHRPEAVVAVLVVATPCPLILATPVAIISGINRAAHYGIIVKGGAAIERIGRANAVVFDKTGTLTTGLPGVDRIMPLDGYSSETILRLAAGLEQLSGHPMARALVVAGQNLAVPLTLPTDVTEAAGLGVSGCVDGHMVDVGSVAYAAQRGLASVSELRRARGKVGVQDDATAVVGIDGSVAGLVLYSDPLRPAVPGMLARLKHLGVREAIMITGDDQVTALAIADEAGISSVEADLLPAQKVDAVRSLMSIYDTVVMVGDGINDAPALATASVGVALGAHGAAVSAEAADIVIIADEVERVADAIAIGQRTLQVARQSIWIGLGLSASMMVVAAFGYIPPALGALFQEGVDVGVILNALRAR